ncbi:DUF1610 domain-containing protein [Candidatus Woesearchaeota archaeon]|nr:MAG: DUF1610 domain-containing protein [Candidatus Woesearchaeota archaeon]
MVEKQKCISCNKDIVNDPESTQFKCPNCGSFVIVRCGHCRKIAARYTCKKCGFTGPN